MFQGIGGYMIKRIQINKIDLFTIFFLITPIISMLFNLFNAETAFYWYIPNLIMLYIGLKSLVLNLKNIKLKEYKLIYTYFVLAFISCIFARDKYQAFFGSEYRLEGLITYISYLGFFYLGTRIKNKRLLNVFIIISVILATLSILRIDLTYKMFGIDKNIHYYFYTGPFTHFNHFGYYLLIANICTILMYIFTNSTISKTLYFLAHLILLYTLIINDTFGVYIAYLIVLIIILIYFISKKQNIKKIIFLIISFILLSCITYRYDYNIHIVYRNIKELFHDTETISNSSTLEDMYEVGTTRGRLWIKGTEYTLKKPILGYGYENVKYEYQNEKIYESKPHNIILDLCLNTGVISMICYVSLIILICKKQIERIKENKYLLCFLVIIGYLLSMMTGNSTFYISPYFYIFLGIFAQGYYNEK